MASTDKTTNLELSQFVTGDKPAWLTDYNEDMRKIDAGFAENKGAGTKNAADIAQNATAIQANATEISNVKQTIAADEAELNKAKQDIITNQANIETNTSKIALHQATLTQVTADVATAVSTSATASEEATEALTKADTAVTRTQDVTDPNQYFQFSSVDDSLAPGAYNQNASYGFISRTNHYVPFAISSFKRLEDSPFAEPPVSDNPSVLPNPTLERIGGGTGDARPGFHLSFKVANVPANFNPGDLGSTTFTVTRPIWCGAYAYHTSANFIPATTSQRLQCQLYAPSGNNTWWSISVGKIVYDHKNTGVIRAEDFVGANHIILPGVYRLTIQLGNNVTAAVQMTFDAGLYLVGI